MKKYEQRQKMAIIVGGILKKYFVTDRFDHCCKTIKIVKAAAKPIC